MLLSLTACQTSKRSLTSKARESNLTRNVYPPLARQVARAQTRVVQGLEYVVKFAARMRLGPFGKMGKSTVIPANRSRSTKVCFASNRLKMPHLTHCVFIGAG